MSRAQVTARMSSVKNIKAFDTFHKEQYYQWCQYSLNVQLFTSSPRKHLLMLVYQESKLQLMPTVSEYSLTSYIHRTQSLCVSVSSGVFRPFIFLTPLNCIGKIIKQFPKSFFLKTFKIISLFFTHRAQLMSHSFDPILPLIVVFSPPNQISLEDLLIQYLRPNAAKT